MRLSRVTLPNWEQPDRPARALFGPIFVTLWGVLIPVALVLYGIACILRQEAMVIGGPHIIMLYGVNAQVAGLALFAIAAIFHVQCFWNVFYDSNPLAARVKLLFLVVLGSSAYFLCYHMLTHAR